MAKKTAGDPTGQRANRRNSTRRLKTKLQIAQKKVVLELFGIAFKKVTEKVIPNKSLTLYQYDVSPDDLETLRLSIQSHLNSELETTTDKMPLDWWYKKEVELPYRQGTLEELNELNKLIEESTMGSPAIVSLPPQQLPPSFVLFSPAYLDGVREAQIRNYGLIKSLNETTAKQVYQTIENGIQSGKSVVEIKQEIGEKFEISHANAKRIADTEVNRAYNDARLKTVKLANDETGEEIAVLHISSLLPTTRREHAARHGNVYTADQQLRWWNDGSNRINCKCTTRSVLIENGKVVQTELQKKIKDMRHQNDG